MKYEIENDHENDEKIGRHLVLISGIIQRLSIFAFTMRVLSIVATLAIVLFATKDLVLIFLPLCFWALEWYYRTIENQYRLVFQCQSKARDTTYNMAPGSTRKWSDIKKAFGDTSSNLTYLAQVLILVWYIIP